MVELGSEPDLMTLPPRFCQRAKLPSVHTYLHATAGRLKNELPYRKVCCELQRTVRARLAVKTVTGPGEGKGLENCMTTYHACICPITSLLPPGWLALGRPIPLEVGRKEFSPLWNQERFHNEGCVSWALCVTQAVYPSADKVTCSAQCQAPAATRGPGSS